MLPAHECLGAVYAHRIEVDDRLIVKDDLPRADRVAHISEQSQSLD